MPSNSTLPLIADAEGGNATIAPLAASTASGSSPDVPQALIDHLKLREGWRTKVYLDSLKKPTAGMGHLLSAAENAQYKVGDTIPDGVLNAWAFADVQKAYADALSEAAQLDVSDQDFVNALASVAFQLGTGWTTKFPNTWAMMKAGKWEAAAEAVQQSLWFKQTPVRVEDFESALRAQITPAPGAEPTSTIA